MLVRNAVDEKDRRSWLLGDGSRRAPPQNESVLDLDLNVVSNLTNVRHTVHHPVNDIVNKRITSYIYKLVLRRSHFDFTEIVDPILNMF